jgi:hypothetical protein
MAVKPANVIVRKDLTDYAFGLMQDLAPVLRLLNILAPVVPTGAMSGLFNKFDDTQAFKAYAEAVARRSIGSQASVIQFLSDTANYNCEPYGLRISVDEAEKQRAGGNTLLLEKAKTRTLTINCAVALLSQVVAAAKAAVAATANKGAWNDAAVDPIAEINSLIKAVYLATGMIPNQVVFDFGAWCVFQDHPLVLKRMPGADVAQVSPERVSKLFANPNAKVEIVETAVLYGGGLGNASATKRSIMGGSVLVFFNSPVPTVYDPGFMKTFAPAAQLFTEVFGYREEPHLDWYENDWTCQPQVIASGLCKRIDVTGANT